MSCERHCGYACRFMATSNCWGQIERKALHLAALAASYPDEGDGGAAHHAEACRAAELRIQALTAEVKQREQLHEGAVGQPTAGTTGQKRKSQKRGSGEVAMKMLEADAARAAKRLALAAKKEERAILSVQRNIERTVAKQYSMKKTK